MDYTVFHYKMNNFNDVSFGCSYRNIQTLISSYKKNYNNNVIIPDIRDLLKYYNYNYSQKIIMKQEKSLHIEPYHISQYLKIRHGI